MKITGAGQALEQGLTVSIAALDNKMSTPPERKPSVDLGSAEFLTPATLPETGPVGASGEASLPDSLASRISDTLLQNLPNDLTRMIYLASLRDCNSGLYLQPDLSPQEGIHAADRALRLCHELVFRRLLTTRLPEYVRQLEEYIRYTRGETVTMLKTWKSLQAYRATVPVGTASISAELFFLNITIALEVLSQRMPELQQAQ
jgi:hypothetical protein